MRGVLRRVRELARSERGLSNLEWIGLVVAAISLLAFVPVLRGWLGDLYTEIFKDGVTARGILITVVALVAFPGSVYLILYTDVGKRLGFLIAGAGLTGWGAINGLLFVLYAPRGPRPVDVEGLNAFQIRIMPGAMMLGSAILFAMFVVALSRLERADEEETS
jgi:hypothetical protein